MQGNSQINYQNWKGQAFLNLKIQEAYEMGFNALDEDTFKTYFEKLQVPQEHSQTVYPLLLSSFTRGFKNGEPSKEFKTFYETLQLQPYNGEVLIWSDDDKSLELDFGSVYYFFSKLKPYASLFESGKYEAKRMVRTDRSLHLPSDKNKVINSNTPALIITYTGVTPKLEFLLRCGTMICPEDPRLKIYIKKEQNYNARNIDIFCAKCAELLGRQKAQALPEVKSSHSSKSLQKVSTPKVEIGKYKALAKQVSAPKVEVKYQLSPQSPPQLSHQSSPPLPQLSPKIKKVEVKSSYSSQSSHQSLPKIKKVEVQSLSLNKSSSSSPSASLEIIPCKIDDKMQITDASKIISQAVKDLSNIKKRSGIWINSAKEYELIQSMFILGEPNQTQTFKKADFTSSQSIEKTLTAKFPDSIPLDRVVVFTVSSRDPRETVKYYNSIPSKERQFPGATLTTDSGRLSGLRGQGEIRCTCKLSQLEDLVKALVNQCNQSLACCGCF